MAALVDVEVISICLLLKPLNICAKSYSLTFLVWQLLNSKDGNVQPLRATFHKGYFRRFLAYIGLKDED